MNWRILFLVLSLSFIAPDLRAQLSGQNLMEYQFGRLPNETGSSFSSIYDRFLLDYSMKGFKAGGTIEQFYTPFSNRNYTRLSQYRLHYNSKPFEVKIGHFYETIGRGLMLRSYEIPGAILEDKSYRSRQYFHRDLLGLTAKFRHKGFTAKMLWAKPLINVLPPTFKEKDLRLDRVAAVQTEYSVKGQLIGTAVMQLDNSTGKSWFAMANASGNILPYLSYYGEMVKNTSEFSLGDFSSVASFAIYGNLNLSFDNFGLSAEYKNYNNFLLGSGFNEPPALVREHSYKLLNRSTHVLQPQNEKGFQFEGFFHFSDESALTLNYTRAVNNFSKKSVFQEYFAEYAFALKEKHDLKLFADWAQDQFKLEEDRFSTGFYADWKLGKTTSMNTSYEYQTFNRTGTAVQNQVFSAGISLKSKFSGYVISEWSNDPVIVDSKHKIWLGTGVKYRVNSKHALQLFAGERRGGPACNSGVCYEVLDFRGVELRLSSRF